MQLAEQGRFPAIQRAWSQNFSLAAPPQYQDRPDGPGLSSNRACITTDFNGIIGEYPLFCPCTEQDCDILSATCVPCSPWKPPSGAPSARDPPQQANLCVPCSPWQPPLGALLDT